MSRKNFTHAEKSKLRELALQNIELIDNRKQDSSTVQSKKMAWEYITTDFNSAALNITVSTTQSRYIFIITT